MDASAALPLFVLGDLELLADHVARRADDVGFLRVFSQWERLSADLHRANMPGKNPEVVRVADFIRRAVNDTAGRRISSDDMGNPPVAAGERRVVRRPEQAAVARGQPRGNGAREQSAL